MHTADLPVVVTGAGGYLGGRVATALGDRGRALVRNSVGWLPPRSQMPCDLLGPPERIRNAVEGASCIIHLAGHNEVVARQDPEVATRETIAMAENVATAARRSGVERVVYVSTVHVYGSNLVPGAQIRETTATAPTSPYAVARLRCEEVYLSAGDLDAVVLRLTNAVGAPADPTVDRWTLVASDLGRRAVLDRVMVLRSSGLQSRDFIALEDACRIVVEAADARRVPAGVFNLASGTSSTIRALAALVQDRTELACGWRPDLDAPPADAEPETPYTVATERLADCGLRSERTLEDGVDEIIDHCIKHEATLREQAIAG